VLPTSGHTCTFGLYAEIERTLISQRIKEALPGRKLEALNLVVQLKAKRKSRCYLSMLIL
jgi:hypothetical protein